MEPNHSDPGAPGPASTSEDVRTERPVGRARARPLASGWLWWKQAACLVSRDWSRWTLAVLVLLAVIVGINLVALLVPLVGGLLPTLLTPLFGAGLFHIAQRRWRGDAFQLGDLFAGLSQRTGPLLLAGLAQMVIQVAFLLSAAVLLVVVFGADMMAAYAGVIGEGALSSPDPGGPGLIGALLVLLLLLALLLPYMAALWFQIPLVYLGGRGPFVALGDSLKAVAINWLAMFWYGVIPLVFGVALMGVGGLLVGLIHLVFGQGVLAAILYGVVALAGCVGGLFLLALCVVSLYASFRDIFGLDAPAD